MTKYTDNWLYISRVGTEEFGARLIVTMVRKHDLTSTEERSLRTALNKYGFWARKDGTLQVRRIPWIDYIKREFREGRNKK